MAEYRKKFVAVDLETTHLDQREGKIMEVGAVEFELYVRKGSKGVGVKFGRTFSSLVNPEVEPSETALAITGIKKDKLVAAPKWKEVKSEFEGFIGTAIVIGHNVGFDLGYLGNQGLKLKNNSLDTLEIARTLLPLLESHSLEGLAEGLEVLEDVPHRALVDCQNTARVLAAILNTFLSYPEKLQREVKEILERGKVEFLDVVADLPVQKSEIRNQKPESESQISTIRRPTSDFQLPFSDKTVYCHPLSFNRLREVAADLAKRKENGVIGLSHSTFLADFPEQKLINPRFALCAVRYERLMSEGQQLSAEMAKILAKITILREVRSSLDLSLIKWAPDEIGLLHYLSVNLDLCLKHKCAYAGGLEKKFIHPHFGDLETVFELGRLGRESKLMLFDLAAIEDEFTAANIRTWNLRKIRNLFAPLYPVDTEPAGLVEKLPQDAEQILNEFDLFFGVLHLVYLKREGEFSENLIIDDRERGEDRFKKLFFPARKLLDKLKVFSGALDRESRSAEHELRFELQALGAALAAVQNFLEEFFISPNEEKISWLEFNSTRVNLNIMPRALQAQWKLFSEHFSSVTIVDAVRPAVSRSYFQQRLGLAGYDSQKCFEESRAEPVPVRIFSQNLSAGEIRDQILNLPGRTLCLLPNEPKLAELYQLLARTNAEILAYKYSGNVSVLKKKLQAGHKDKLAWLLTVHALLKHWQSLPSVHNLVIFKLPFEARGSKPQLLGLEERGGFMEAILPRAVNQIHQMISMFLSAPGSPKQVWILDPRILTDYDQSFLKYFEEFPDFRVSTA